MTNENFDHIINQKLHDFTAPVSTSLWDKIRVPALEVPADSFDEYVKTSLKDFIAPVPANMWEKVKPKEEERRRFLLLSRTSMIAASILLLVLAGSVSAYLYYQKVQSSQVTKEDAAITLPQQSIEPSKEENNSPDKTKTVVGINEQQETTIPAENKEEHKTDGDNVSITTNKPNDNGVTYYKSGLTLNGNKQNSASQFSLSNANLLKSTLYKNLDKTTNKEDYSNNLNEASSVNVLEESYTLTDKAGNAYFVQQKNNKRFTSEKTISDFNHANGVKNVIICPSDKKIRNTDWDVEVYASPDYAVKTITNNTASPQFMSTKDSSESSRIGFTAGFRIVKPLNDHFLLKTGLQYTQINEKFSYRTENEIKTTTVVTVRTIIRAPGDTVIIRDTSSVQQIGYKNNTVKNRYRSIDIPVLLGYQFGNEDLKIGINAGVIVNLTSWYQGVLLDSSLAPVPITKESNMTYKNNVGLGLYAGVSITKRLNYSTLVFVEPYLRYNLSNMTTPQSSYTQRFTLGGLSIGLRLNLNSR